MIKKYSLLLLQKAINKALLLDNNIPEKIKPLDGKTLEIVIAPLNVHFFMAFKDSEIHLMSEQEGLSDAVIESSPLGLIRLSLLPASKVRSLFNDKVKISGDVEFGHHVKKLFDDIDIDWEGHLARFTGDVIAYQVGSLVRKGRSFQQHVHNSLKENMTEFLQEELNVCPPREEMNDFFHDLDELTLDVERLALQINQLLVRDEIH